MRSPEKDSPGNTGGVREVPQWIVGPQPRGAPGWGGAGWQSTVLLGRIPAPFSRNTARASPWLYPQSPGRYPAFKHAQVDCPRGSPLAPGWPASGFLRNTEWEPRASCFFRNLELGCCTHKLGSAGPLIPLDTTKEIGEAAVQRLRLRENQQERKRGSQVRERISGNFSVPCPCICLSLHCILALGFL